MDLGRENKNAYLLIDDFSPYLLASCFNLIMGYGTEVDYILGGTTSYLQVMNVGIKKPFKGHIRQADKDFMPGNTSKGKDSMQGNILKWIGINWGKLKVETVLGHGLRLRLCCSN